MKNLIFKTVLCRQLFTSVSVYGTSIQILILSVTVDTWVFSVKGGSGNARRGGIPPICGLGGKGGGERRSVPTRGVLIGSPLHDPRPGDLYYKGNISPSVSVDVGRDASHS